MAFVALLLALSALAACTSGSRPRLTATGSSGAASQATGENAVKAGGGGATTVSEDQVPVMEIARVPGLSWHEDAETEVAMRTTWFTVADATALNAAVDADVHRRIAAYKAVVAPNVPHPGEPLTVVANSAAVRSPLAAVRRPARSQLDVSATLTAVSPTVIGLRLASFDATPQESRLEFTSYYWDATDNRVHGAADLFADAQAREKFVAAVRQGLRGVAGVSASQAQGLAEANLTSVSFRRDGTAVAELSQGLFAGLGSVAIPVAAATASPLLSPFGARVQAAVRTPGTYPGGVQLPPGSTPLTAGSGTTSSTPTTPNCAVEKCVALTYDDGPVPDTNRLLDTLKAKHVPVTFFVVGQMLRRHPEILRREKAEGHEIGDHSMSHPKLTKLTAAKQEYEIGQDAALIQQTLGTAPTLMRPPYGVYNAQVEQILGRHHLENIIWDVDSRDWATKSADATVAMVNAMVQPGSIVLMHDLHPTTVDAAPAVIDTLAARGFKFVTVSQLLDGTNPQPGQHYSCRPGARAGEDRTAG